MEGGREKLAAEGEVTSAASGTRISEMEAEPQSARVKKQESRRIKILGRYGGELVECQKWMELEGSLLQKVRWRSSACLRRS